MPQDKVKWIALVGVVDIATPLARVLNHLLAGVVAHTSEGIEFADIEIHRTTRDVGESTFENHSDKPANIGNCRRGARR